MTYSLHHWYNMLCKKCSTFLFTFNILLCRCDIFQFQIDNIILFFYFFFLLWTPSEAIIVFIILFIAFIWNVFYDGGIIVGHFNFIIWCTLQAAGIRPPLKYKTCVRLYNLKYIIWQLWCDLISNYVHGTTLMCMYYYIF